VIAGIISKAPTRLSGGFLLVALGQLFRCVGRFGKLGVKELPNPFQHLNLIGAFIPIGLRRMACDVSEHQSPCCRVLPGRFEG
jgi:hypothetical protein